MRYLSVLFFLVCCISCSRNTHVVFEEWAEQKRIDVFIEGELFTSFLYADTLHKQILYPVYTASGKTITRGFPLNSQPEEATDHPHQVGLWFNFGDVNGLDYWNNSYRVPEDKKCLYGTITLSRIVKVGEASRQIAYEADWIDCHKNVLLKESTTYTFDGKADTRTIIRSTTLTANTEVRLTENKEGLFALRVGRDFEESVTGVYTNKEGLQKGNVWGKRSPWVMLSGTKEEEDISIVLLDHPDNINYPAWWHARGYGLFAVNNLGGSTFDRNTDKVVIELPKGEKLAFKYKVLITNGRFLSEDEVERETDF